MSLARLGAAAVLLFAVSVVVGQDPKKDPPKVDPPKVDPKAADPKAPQPTPPKAPDPKDPKAPQPPDPKAPAPQPDPKAAPPQPTPKVELKPGDPRTFATAFTVNQKFYQEVTNNVTQIIKVQGQDLTQSQGSTFYYEWTPLKQEGDNWFVRMKVEGLKMSIDISGNVISFNSAQPDASPTAGNPGLTEFFKKLVGAEFTSVINAKTNKVERVEGRDAFIAAIGAGSPQMESLLKRVLTDDALKQMADPNLGLAADAPKKVGDTWDKKVPVNLGPIGTYNVTYVFKYAEAQKDGLDRIEVTVSMDYTAPKESPEGLLFRIKDGTLKTDPAAPGKGTILYDPKAQRIASADISFKLKGELTVTIGGTDTKVELTQEQKTQVKAQDTSFMAPPTPVPPKK